MKRIKSVSEKRLIIQCDINNKKGYFLLDSGASVPMIDKSQVKKYNLKIGRRYNGTIVGAGGEMQDIYCCDTFVYVEDKTLSQFLIADIGSVVSSIKRETNIEILGIISLPQMKFIGIQIDMNDNEIIFE